MRNIRAEIRLKWV